VYWLIPIILATQVAEIWRIDVQGGPVKNVTRHFISTNKKLSTVAWACHFSYV
jgi:hypothetical protein